MKSFFFLVSWNGVFYFRGKCFLSVQAQEDYKKKLNLADKEGDELDVIRAMNGCHRSQQLDKQTRLFFLRYAFLEYNPPPPETSCQLPLHVLFSWHAQWVVAFDFWIQSFFFFLNPTLRLLIFFLPYLWLFMLTWMHVPVLFLSFFYPNQLF